MKILKTILKWLAILVIALLVAALFMKKEFQVEKEIVINKSRQEVFDYVKHLKNQEEWGVWTKMDPNIKKTYTGTDGTEGFTYAWEGNKKVGKGEQKIVKINEGQRVDFQLHFIEPFESVSPAYITTEDADAGKTKVKWGISGKMMYPFNIMGLFMDKTIGNDFQTGLDNLKAILEK